MRGNVSSTRLEADDTSSHLEEEASGERLCPQSRRQADRDAITLKVAIGRIETAISNDPEGDRDWRTSNKFLRMGDWTADQTLRSAQIDLRSVILDALRKQQDNDFALTMVMYAALDAHNINNI